MRKKIKSIFSVILAVVIIVASVMPSLAIGEGLVWQQLWEQEYENGVVLFPGRNNSEMNVSWYSATESSPIVLVSESYALKNAKEFTGYSVKTYNGDYSNKVTITGLEAGKTYFYKCISGDFESNVYSFKTDDNENEFSAIYMTDIHITEETDDETRLFETSKKFDKILSEAVTKHNPSILLSAGDQASSGLESEYKGLASAVALKSVPIAASIGNHDRKGVDYKTFTNLPNENEKAAVSSYVGENYWFVKGDVLFLVMDSNCGSGTDHRKFVKNALKENPNVKWKIMMAHHDMYSGRIPHRESENQLIRMLWAPIADEFGIDLVLLGHSHYYTVSNVLYNNKSVDVYKPEMKDVEGTIYMVSGSINNPRNDDEIGLNEEWIGCTNTPNEKAIYNVLDFTENTITVSSYYQGENDAFNTYSITKTSNNGGHPDMRIRSPFDVIVRCVGTIYAWFNNIGVYGDLKDDGYDIKLFDFIF